MRKESIMEMIDKRIIESYVNGFTSLSIIEDIATRVANMSRVIKDEGFDIDNFIDLEFEELESEDFQKEKLPKTRVKYTIFYIKHSKKRIDDIIWLDSKKKLFQKFSNSQIFKLIKLKEKLLVTLPF
jgi:hypothetical protein